MTEAENIDRVVTALLKVPEKKLLIIEIANTIPIVNGELDYAELANRQLDINLAIAEAKVYGSPYPAGGGLVSPAEGNKGGVISGI